MSTIPDDFYSGYKQGDESDRKLIARFSVEAKVDGHRMADALKADPNFDKVLYKDVEYVTILIPGDKTLNVHRPVQPADRARFATSYNAFLQKKGAVLLGIPLAGWPLVSESQRKELDYFNIATVEQLAEVSDNFAGGMMGVQQLKQAAQKFLAANREAAPTVKLMKELETRDNTIAAMQAQIADLAARLPIPEAAPVKPAKGK